MRITKTACDICHKETPTKVLHIIVEKDRVPDGAGSMENIHYGYDIDICPECAVKALERFNRLEKWPAKEPADAEFPLRRIFAATTKKYLNSDEYLNRK